MARTFNTLVFLFTYFLHVNIKQQSTTEASVRARRSKISEGTSGNSEAEGKTCGDLGKDAGEADHHYQLMPPLAPLPAPLPAPPALSLNVLEPTAAEALSLAKLASWLARLGLAWRRFIVEEGERPSSDPGRRRAAAHPAPGTLYPA